ncbi:MAG: rRNA maturation RNase YbeY [Sedimentisphaerales bacterium]|nr:rRNA maturation RNase YbeY [Sedimentisphaerales bacterium]
MPTITVQIAPHFQGVPVDRPALEALTQYVCTRFGVTRAVVSIGIVDDAEMSRLNEKFLGHSQTTDCLSFDLSEQDGPRPDRVFDLIVNGALALREAAGRGHTGPAELALYITHGLLHNLGFDDATPSHAREMHRMEDEILQHLGYGFVYDEHRQAQ